jgi:hypothetical protein
MVDVEEGDIQLDVLYAGEWPHGPFGGESHGVASVTPDPIVSLLSVQDWNGKLGGLAETVIELVLFCILFNPNMKLSSSDGNLNHTINPASTRWQGKRIPPIPSLNRLR